jgi:hypothetical protein
MTIAQFPIENHSEQGQVAESPPKTVGKVQQVLGVVHYAIRSSSFCGCFVGYSKYTRTERHDDVDLVPRQLQVLFVARELEA